MIPKEAAIAVWNLLLDRAEARMAEEGLSLNAFAAKIGVPQATLYKWVKQERGKQVSLTKVLELATKLGVPMSEVLAQLLPQEVVNILSAREKDPKAFDQFLSILNSDGPEADKLKSDLDYYSDKTSKK